MIINKHAIYIEKAVYSLHTRISCRLGHNCAYQGVIVLFPSLPLLNSAADVTFTTILRSSSGCSSAARG